MPYRSKKQHKYFRWAESEGKLPEGTASRWAHETADMKSLPEKKKVKEASYIPFSYGYGLLKLAEPIKKWLTDDKILSDFVAAINNSDAIAPDVKQNVISQITGYRNAMGNEWSTIREMAYNNLWGKEPQDQLDYIQTHLTDLDPNVQTLWEQNYKPMSATSGTKESVPAPAISKPPAGQNKPAASPQVAQSQQQPTQPTQLNANNNGTPATNNNATAPAQSPAATNNNTPANLNSPFDGFVKSLGSGISTGLNFLGGLPKTIGSTFESAANSVGNFVKDKATAQWGKNMLGTLGAVGAGAWGLYNAFTNPQEKQPFQPSPTGLGQAQQPLRSVNQNIGRDIYGKKPTFSS
jgi:hypothetical protein